MSFAGREQPLSVRGTVAFTPAINWWGFLSAYLHSIQIIFPVSRHTHSTHQSLHQQIASTYSATARFAPFCPAGLAGACDRPNHRTLGPLSGDGVARLNGRDGLSRLDTGAYDWCSLSALPRIPTAQAAVLP